MQQWNGEPHLTLRPFFSICFEMLSSNHSVSMRENMAANSSWWWKDSIGTSRWNTLTPSITNVIQFFINVSIGFQDGDFTPDLLRMTPGTHAKPHSAWVGSGKYQNHVLNSWMVMIEKYASTGIQTHDLCNPEQWYFHYSMGVCRFHQNILFQPFQNGGYQKGFVALVVEKVL